MTQDLRVDNFNFYELDKTFLSFLGEKIQSHLSSKSSDAEYLFILIGEFFYYI